jgi:hypothetical protein
MMLVLTVHQQQNSFRALYRTFTQCCVIEDEGDIVFYKNSKGEAARVIADNINIRDYSDPSASGQSTDPGVKSA